MKMVVAKTNLLLCFVFILSSLSAPSLQAAEDDLYQFDWLDKDKKVYVIQNRLFKKEGKTFISLGALNSSNGPYQDTLGGQVKIEYYFHEYWGLEFFTNFYKNSDNDDLLNIKKINQSTPFIRKVNSQYALLALWSPFYGKINTFNQIFYFDWSFGLGPSIINTESNRLTVANPEMSDHFNNDKYIGVSGKTQVRFYLNKRVHLDLSLLRTSYKAPGPDLPGRAAESKWRGHTDAILSLGLSF